MDAVRVSTPPTFSCVAINQIIYSVLIGLYLGVIVYTDTRITVTKINTMRSNLKFINIKFTHNYSGMLITQSD